MKEKDYAERLRAKRNLLQEEEEEERELNAYYLKLESMRENCLGEGAQIICGLIEEQMELLNALKEEREKYLDEWDKRNMQI